MATYSSATNPFIKASTSTNGLERPIKKDAPGMAILQNVPLDRSQNKCKSIVVNLMQRDIVTANNLDVNNNGILDLPQLTHQMESINLAEPKQKAETDLQDDNEAIALTCQKLVDATIRQELENMDIDSGTKKLEKDQDASRESNRFNFIEVDSLDHDEDGEELEFENETAPMGQDDRRYQHIELIKKLRLQLRDLERYAYERGELEQVPPSVLAERQTVILETLKERLSLKLDPDDIERSNLDDLKRQVDKEIHDLIDPLITKEHLLGQLKTQLTDLERYIAHLHKTIGKNSDDPNCSCRLHGCSSSQASHQANSRESADMFKNSSLMNNDALPKTSRLIRSLVTQLICSDVKLQESAKKEKFFEDDLEANSRASSTETNSSVIQKVPNFHDGAAWTLHIDKVLLATDSLVNLYTLEPKYQRSSDKTVDGNLVESIVRRRLIPAIKDLLSYGLIDPSITGNTTSYLSLLFDPYYLLSSLTCFPSSQKNNSNGGIDPTIEKFHIWNVIEDYYESRSGPSFKSSSIKTLSQSFNLAPSISGPIKITSKQALLIAVDDIIETLAKCKPNGPESHFRSFVYTALNRAKLSTWLRLVFKNKSIVNKYYHNFSFVSQPDKMNKFLTTLDALSKIEFKLSNDVQSAETFVSAF